MRQKQAEGQTLFRFACECTMRKSAEGSKLGGNCKDPLANLLVAAAKKTDGAKK